MLGCLGTIALIPFAFSAIIDILGFLLIIIIILVALFVPQKNKQEERKD